MVRKEDKRERLICGSLLVFFSLAYYLLYFNNVYPVSEGWGIYYSELINRGMVPYRDFYYYLPPLNLLIDGLFWKLSFGSLLAFRGWYLLFRIVTIVLLFRLLARYIAPRYAWITALTAACLGAACVYDLCGDYNQTEVFLIVVLTGIMSAFLERTESGDMRRLARYAYFFAAGVVIGLMLLLKQSTALATILICILVLLFYCVFFRDRNWLRYIVGTAVGILVPCLICMVYLVLNHAFVPFLDNFFGAANAKGGIGTILATIYYKLFSSAHRGLLIVTLTIIAAVFVCRQALRRRTAGACVMAIASLLLLGLIVNEYYHSGWALFLDFIRHSMVLLISAVATLLLAVFCIRWSKRNRLRILTAWNYTGFLSALLLVSFLMVFANFQNLPSKFYSETTVFSDVIMLVNYASLLTVLGMLLYGLLSCIISKHLPFSKPSMMLFAGAFIACYSTYMASGVTALPERPMFISFAVAAALLLSSDRVKKSHFGRLAISLICVVICTICMTQKYSAPYSWWGTNAVPLDQRVEPVNLDYFKGIRLDMQTRLQYEEVTRLIEHNSEPDDTVWGFPFVKIFNVLTDRYNTDDPVPVLFYDVCSDEAAEAELDWLINNEPKIVIWCDIPNCLETHERVFRNGQPSGQRDIISWFKAAKESDYTLIGQVGNLFVYRLNDGSPINYTFYQNINAVNSTA